MILLYIYWDFHGFKIMQILQQKKSTVITISLHCNAKYGMDYMYEGCKLLLYSDDTTSMLPLEYQVRDVLLYHSDRILFLDVLSHLNYCTVKIVVLNIVFVYSSL